MNVEEFKNEFFVAYNAIAGQSAPSIDDYELSLYFTKAQLEIVKNYYDSDSNRKRRGFEGSEKRRVDLRALIKDYKNSSSFINSSAINSNSRFYTIPNEVMFIINEKAKVLSSGCNLNSIIEVIPVTYDEYNTNINNPFKSPDSNKIWRLDISNISGKTVEIISTYPNLEYQIRYIKYPKPIIITDLTTSFPSEDLTIDGITAITPCELDQEIHREIIDRAVEIALLDLRPDKLEGKVQLDIRNE